MNACDVCGLAAPISVTALGTTRWMCESCFRIEEPVDGLASMMASLRYPRASRRSCPNCGWTAEQAELEERVGCPLCYESLETPLLTSFERPV